MKRTPSTSFRLTAEARKLVYLLSRQFGVSQTAVMERAVRELAARQKIEVKR